MADYTNLDLADVEKIFDQFSDQPVVSTNPLPGGRANSSFLIGTHEGSFVLTVCNAKEKTEVESSVLLMEQLQKEGLCTPRTYRTLQGQPTASYLGQPVTLKRFEPGDVRRDLGPGHLRQIGKTLAKLHTLTPWVELADEFSYGLQTFPEVVGWSGSGDFGRWLEAKYQSLGELKKQNFPRGLIHGDLFWDNVVVNGDSLTLIDFEEACHYSLGFDLGMSIVGCCFCADGLWTRLVGALLEGYQEIRPLQSAERENLQSFAVYGATATACWRFWQYNINLPESAERFAYREMQDLADRIESIEGREFQSTIP